MNLDKPVSTWPPGSDAQSALSHLGPPDRKKLEAAMSVDPKPCIICEDLTPLFGLFIPTDPVAWGAQKGKTRHIVYPLCPTCHDILPITVVRKRLHEMTTVAQFN